MKLHTYEFGDLANRFSFEEDSLSAARHLANAANGSDDLWLSGRFSFLGASLGTNLMCTRKKQKHLLTSQTEGATDSTFLVEPRSLKMVMEPVSRDST